MRPLPTVLLVFSLSILPGMSGCKRSHQAIRHATSSEPDYTTPLQAAISSGHMDSLKFPDFTDLQPQVSSFYAGRESDLAWLSGGKLTKQADALLQEFSNASNRGLRPEDYDASRWRERALNLQSPDAAVKFDVALTVNAMRFITDLHMGRTNPAGFTFGVKGYDSKKLDLPAVLTSQFVDAGDIPGTLDALEPQSEQYRALKAALPHYRELADKDDATQLPEIDKSAKPVTLSAGYPGLAALRQRLQTTGDLDSNAADDLGSLPEALTRFQHRHGLNETGKLSHDTVVELNRPMSARLAQIEDTMERWRWLNDDYSNAAVLVNLPEFELRAYEGRGSDHHEVFRMNVVDGKSDDDTHHTPVIADLMKYLVFRPFWNVPPSIAKKEIIPHMESNSGYLSSRNYETVDLKGNPAGADVARIARGTVMVRQKSGTSNSLGLVKFMFPNPFNVYLHDTNEKALFSRTRRDYSHGCVRLQDPVKLANWVLRDNPKWDSEAIDAAMQTGDDNKSVPLPRPLPVVIFYATAWSENGELHFFKDMYGYDDDMQKVLDKGRPYPQKPVKAVTEKDV